MNTRIRVGVSILLLASAFSACGRDLSRAKAAELITKAYSLPQPEKLEIGKSYLRRSWNDPSNFPAICWVKSIEYDNVANMLTSLQSKGLIVIGDRTTKQGECNYSWADVSLTSEGNKYMLNADKDQYIVRASDITLAEVTGIQVFQDRKLAVADFTLKRINITPFGNPSASAPQGGRATFSLFDDGWRLIRE